MHTLSSGYFAVFKKRNARKFRRFFTMQWRHSGGLLSIHHAYVFSRFKDFKSSPIRRIDNKDYNDNFKSSHYNRFWHSLNTSKQECSICSNSHWTHISTESYHIRAACKWWLVQIFQIRIFKYRRLIIHYYDCQFNILYMISAFSLCEKAFIIYEKAKHAIYEKNVS